MHISVYQVLKGKTELWKMFVTRVPLDGDCCSKETCRFSYFGCTPREVYNQEQCLTSLRQKMAFLKFLRNKIFDYKMNRNIMLEAKQWEPLGFSFFISFKSYPKGNIMLPKCCSLIWSEREKKVIPSISIQQELLRNYNNIKKF